MAFANPRAPLAPLGRRTEAMFAALEVAEIEEALEESRGEKVLVEKAEKVEKAGDR